ncbi:hypothetical protein KAI54_00300, partial [Candidatus Gracilibacteria bacterium]|nr:hypothetical protein [Candidatus Gracilibacteria bacterium]
MLFASLIFAHSPTPFTYSSELKNLKVGDLVAAPLRGKILNGIVTTISETPPKFSVKPLSQIVRKKVLV